MRLLVFGRSGQVATELARRVPQGVAIEALGREHADFTDPEAVARAVGNTDAEAVLNAVAYTAVDRAETERDTARTVNASAVARLAEACAARNLPLVHVSTDYVFAGEGETPHRPDDPFGPLNHYGATKLAGEEAIRSAGGVHVILRTSWVFSAHGGNFVTSMLRLSETRDRLTIVADQIGGPTPAAAIADALYTTAISLLRGGPSGSYHFAGAPDVSWADFARQIFAEAGRAVEVVDIPTADYPTPARRPANSRLDCTTLARDHGIERPDWRTGLADVIKELGA